MRPLKPPFFNDRQHTIGRWMGVALSNYYMYIVDLCDMARNPSLLAILFQDPAFLFSVGILFVNADTDSPVNPNALTTEWRNCSWAQFFAGFVLML